MSKKFETEDLPKILLALKQAMEFKSPTRVTIDFAADGGVISVLVEPKIRHK